MKYSIIRVLAHFLIAPKDHTAYKVWRICNTISLAGLAIICVVLLHLLLAIAKYDDWQIPAQAVRLSLWSLGACIFGTMGAYLVCTDE